MLGAEVESDLICGGSGAAQDGSELSDVEIGAVASCLPRPCADVDGQLGRGVHVSTTPLELLA